MEKEKEREKGRRHGNVNRSYRTASPLAMPVNFQSYAMPLGRSNYHFNKKEKISNEINAKDVCSPVY